MNEYESLEQEILDKHEPRWSALGYRVVRHPGRARLPEFLQGYIPDALLVGRSPNVVVEVVLKGRSSSQKRIKELVSLLEGRDDWRLEVLYAGESEQRLPTLDRTTLVNAIKSARDLMTHERRGSLLLAWSTLEAVARYLMPEATRRPQSPGRVVELLASAGHITPTEAEMLRESMQWRNRVVHGGLERDPPKEQVLGLIELVERLAMSLGEKS